MGCGGSKDGGKEDKKINSDFAWIQIARFDEFFRTAGGLLENCETIRSGIEDTKEEGAELSHTYMLKEPKYTDTVQVLFWAASAENNGKIKDTDLDITSEAPFVRMNGRKITHDTYTLYESFSTYLKTIIEGPSTLKDSIEKLSEMAQQAPDLVKEGKTEIQNSSLDFKGKAMAIARLGKNAAKLPKELAKCKALQELLTQAKTDMQELIPKLKDLATKADEVGGKAAAEGLKYPGEIFDKYHPGPKKTPKEIEEEKKAQEKGKAKKAAGGKPADTKAGENKAAPKK